MVTPRAESYSAASGGAIYAGMAAPSTLPAWAVGSPLNAWIAIPGTAGCGGAAVDPWGGFPLRDEGGGLVQTAFLAAGGHSNSSDNRVVSCDFSADSPSWVPRVTTSPIPFDDGIESDTLTNYYSWDVTKGDNPKPGSSHLYDYIGWSKYAQKYYRYCATGAYHLGGGSRCMDSIAPIDVGGGHWQWDAPGTNPLHVSTVGQGSTTTRGNPDDGYIWRDGYKWRPGDTSWTAQSAHTFVRFPNAFDRNRNAVFGMCVGNGEDRVAGYTAKQNFFGTGTSRAITLVDAQGSAGATKLLADRPDYAGMDYDSFNDFFLFGYDKYQPGAGLDFQGFLKITPSSGATWEVSIFATAGGGVTPGRTPSDGSGINGRLKYSPTLGGFIYISKGADGAYFMRTK